jgi:hypothetical protein
VRYLIALIVPLALLFCGAFAKKLVRGTGWERKDFYLGVELTLAAMSSGMLYFFELVQPGPSGTSNTPSPEKITVTALFVIVCFFLLLLVLSMHQDWEKSTDIKRQIGTLGVFSNGLGVGLVCSFALLVKVV